jgi:methionine sulfoxide reductase heme-binding subunit
MTDSLLWYTTRGAGAVSLVLLSAAVVLGLLSARRFEASGWPRFLTTGLHRNLSLLAVVFTALHVVTAIVDPYVSLGWITAVVPFAQPYRTFWMGLGTIGSDLVAAVVVTSLVRRPLGHAGWRGVHWLAYAAWPVALAHGLGTGTDTGAGWMLTLVIVCSATVVLAAGCRLVLGRRDPLRDHREGFRAAVQRSVRP